MSRKFRIFKAFLLVLVLVLVATACGVNSQLPSTVEETTVSTVTATLAPSPTVTPTPVPPSPTPVPSAAFVNGEMITLNEYQAELARFQAAGQTAADDAGLLVINDLVDQVLLAQAAREAGFVVEEAEIDTRIADLVSKLDGEQALNEWMANNSYTQESFRSALSRSLAGAWMRDQIISEVPDTAGQVHARQILVQSADEANQIHAQLEAGKEFASLADVYDPVAGGELGWFPQGYLELAEVETAAFSLQPGEFSPVIETPLGFHIIQVLEREDDRLLDSDARLILQMNALQDWLDTRREQSQINISVP